MKIGFVNPYFDSFGGGERYALTLASHWAKMHDVSIFWDDRTLLRQASLRLGIELSNVEVVPNVFRSRFSKYFKTATYDLLFVLSDGSIPMTLARHSILHFQVPFPRVPFPLVKRMLYQHIICNSQFTKTHIDATIGKSATVIYPPVPTDAFTFGKKSKIILSVGRFSSHFQAKKQEVLIDMFKKGYRSGLFKDWKLFLAGGLLEPDEGYFEKLRRLAKGFPIEFYVNVDFNTIVSLYGQSMIYWHAAGFGEQDPARMEHFGISTVEAMASGCIPVVYQAGGQSEIVKHGASGYLWKTKEQCLSYTHAVIKTARREELIRSAQKKANMFSVSVFTKKFDDLLSGITR